MAKKPKKQEQAPPPPEPSKAKTKTKTKSSSPAPVADEPKKPARGLAIGENFGWTGKLPVTLLNEHCQKQKWGKCNYDMIKKPKGFICVVTLHWENPKTREDISIKYWPNYEPKETTNQARHMTATFVLHRINYIKNMKMLLPIIFRDYWTELEVERSQLSKENKTLHDIRYNVNPFTVHLQQQELSERKEKERQVKEQNELKVKKPTIALGSTDKSNTRAPARTSTANLITEISRTPKFPRKVWENAPFIDIPSDVRSSLEVAIRQHIDWIDNEDETSNLLKSAEQATKYHTQLVELGFRKSHIDEAFNHTGKFVDALEWLIFHVPEDDLPPVFSKSDRDKQVELKISKDIQSEYALKRLSHSGFDHDEILQALKENDKDEFKTCIKLTHSLIPAEYEQAENTNSDEDLWKQEIEAIEMSGTKVEAESGDKKTISIMLSPQDIPQENVLSVKLFKSENYPQEIPGIHIIVLDSKYKLANYVKLSIVRQLIEYLYESHLTGECMIYSIIEWLQDNMSRIIKDPGQLVPTITKKLKSPTNGKSIKTKQSNRNTKHTLSPQDISKLEQEYSKRQASSELKTSLTKRAKLPAWNKRQDLISTITSNKVTLITGETGSGKSTQVVQFILDYLNSQGDFSTKIMCTQPRRISTIGLAERISEERVDKMGNETGYIIRGENRTSAKTRISFVTTGVLLRMLQSFLSGKGGGNNVFDDLGYIFIDEVHERSVDGDFLLIILKKISHRFKNLKIILMSATINIDKFVNFFNTPLKHIHIEGRTFPIKDYYLEGILDEIDYSIQNNDGETVRPSADSHYFKTGNLNYDLIAKLTSHIDKKLASENNDGSILIFMPGIMEINQTVRAINNTFQSKVLTLPLHSALTSNEQRRVFKTPPKGTRKVVVSTNVAETSITIPDCVVVIDTGRSKNMFFDVKLNTTKLIENWCSQAEIAQRRGRSGRITNGNCYHLYTQTTVDSMIPQPIPEIKRTRLENLYLVVKAMGISQVEEFLQSGLDAPDSTSLSTSRKFLHDLGALVDDKLSHLGEYLSYLPTDPASGKLLILGCIFGCVDVCLTLAAISSTGSPFINSFDNRDKIKQTQRKFAGDQGDLVAMVNAYSMYQEYKEQGKNTKKFIADNFLSYTTLNDITSTRSQYVSLLKDLGFVPIHYKSTESKLNRNGNNSFIIRAIVTGAFYPQVARVQYPDPKYFKSAQGSIAMDPDARSIKFWVRNEEYMKEIDQGKDINELPASRVFIHPSSVIFNDNNSNFTVDEDFLAKISNEDGTIDYQQARELMNLTPQVSSSSQTLRSSFVAFRSSHHTTKLYVRDVTPTTTLITLLFGGEIQYNLSDINKTTSSPGIVVDSWLPIRTWCKNAVLIKRLRKLVDGLIEERLRNPQYENELMGANNDDILTIIENDDEDVITETESLVPRSNKIKYDSIKETSHEQESPEQLTHKDIEELPLTIREVVPLQDDPTIPVITFRYFILSIIFIVPGAFIDTMNAYRTTSAAYSIFFVQIVSHWAGKWLARTLPRRKVRVLGFKIDLNPGPWSIKETAMVTITANSGATGNMATNAISLADLYFGETVSPLVSLGFMFAIVFVGYSYAALARSLVYDPQLPWPQALMQTTLLQSQAKADTRGRNGNRQMKVFFIVMFGIMAWQFLPEFLFPFTSSLAILCWIAPYNETVNFIGSGLGGMGVLNFSLDWANITSSIMLYPYWIQVIQFIAFVIGAWILIPLVKFTNIVEFKHGLMSNSLFTSNGTIYPTKELLTSNLELNMTAYEMYGPIHLGAQRAWNMFFDYAAYISGITWVVLFGWDKFKLSFSRRKDTSTIKYTDRLTKLQAKYESVPSSWYITLFIVSFTMLMTIFLSGNMFMPWWACLVALVLGSIIVTPLAWLYAISNFQLAIGTFNELVYGYMIQHASSKHPAGALVFGSIAGNAWYRAQFHLECMRLGFYNHLPPKAVFFSQLFGEIIGIPINYLALRWVLSTKREYLTGGKIDPLHQWTGQTISASHTNAIQYVVLGPSRLFENYPLLPYGFILGFVGPYLIYKLDKKYPRYKFNLWNTTVFFSSMSKFYGNISTGYLSRFIGGTITMYWAFRYHHKQWKRYNYILAAAMDTGYNLAVLGIFLMFSFFVKVEMVNWWGNNAVNIERCFALT
ncbi:putative ATP-dependent RNA helicase [Spathaspora sp. JA1]|nr:putative ATP-dependent RNA helicase [Spathaspora sp. JA1]